MLFFIVSAMIVLLPASRPVEKFHVTTCVRSFRFSSSFRFFLFLLIFLTFSSCFSMLFFFSTFCFTTSSSAGDATLLMVSSVCVCPR